MTPNRVQSMKPTQVGGRPARTEEPQQGWREINNLAEKQIATLWNLIKEADEKFGELRA